MQRAVEVDPLPREVGVGPHPEVHEEVARRPAPGSGGALLVEAQCGALVDAGGNVDGVGPGAGHPALTPAGVARRRDLLAQAAASRAGRRRDHLAQDRLSDSAELAGPAAHRAGGGLAAVSRARARAGLAGDRSPHRDLALGAEDRLVEPQVEDRLEVGAPRWAAGAAAAAVGGASPEEGVDEVVEAAAREPAPEGVLAPAAAQAGVAEGVVAAALLRVGQRLVGHGHLLEALLGCGVTGVQVGVHLPSKLAVGLLDLIVAGAPGDAEDPVEVGH